jgi:ABC-type phosphate transport system auxiliary subunit
MDVNSFCGMMQSEINTLKAKVYDIMRAVEKIKDKKKKTQAAQIADLHALIEHLSEMNRQLEKACPLDWSKEKKEIEAKKAELHEKIDIWDSEHLAGLVDN